MGESARWGSLSVTGPGQGQGGSLKTPSKPPPHPAIWGSLCCGFCRVSENFLRVHCILQNKTPLGPLCPEPVSPFNPHEEFDLMLQIPAQKPAPSPFQDTVLNCPGPAAPASPRSAFRGSPTQLILHMFFD